MEKNLRVAQTTSIMTGLKNIILGLTIGMLIMINQVCQQKDSTIRLLMKSSSVQAATVDNIPKNLPIITNFKK